MSGAGEWFACENPERPTDPYVRWHYRECTGCRVKAEALSHMHPSNTHVAWLVGLMAGNAEAAS